MPDYRYEALNPDGMPASGEVEAASRADAVDRLRAQNLRVIALRSLSPPATAEESHDIRSSDFYEMTAHIADLTSANLPLAPALEALARELPRGRVQQGLSAIAAGLRKGADLPAVLHSQGAPADLVALIQAGSRARRLGDFLTQYIVHYRKNRTLRRRIWLSLIYPLLLLVAAALISVFATYWVVPEFKKIFEDFGVQLPGITLLVIAISDFIVNYWVFLVITLAVASIALWISARAMMGSTGWRRLGFAIPFAGTVFKSSTMAWFANLLALLTENNVPLPEALLLAGDGTGDPLLRESCRKLVASNVARGEPFSLVAHEIPVFPALFVQMLSLENQQNALPGALRALAEIYEKQTQARGGVVGMLIAPFVLFGFILFVGFIVLSLFMPLIKLLNDLS